MVLRDYAPKASLQRHGPWGATGCNTARRCSSTCCPCRLYRQGICFSAAHAQARRSFTFDIEGVTGSIPVAPPSSRVATLTNPVARLRFMIDLSADPSRQNVSPIQSIDELTAKISRSRVPFSNAMIPQSRVTSIRRSTVHVRFCSNSGLKSDIALWPNSPNSDMTGTWPAREPCALLLGKSAPGLSRAPSVQSPVGGAKIAQAAAGRRSINRATRQRRALLIGSRKMGLSADVEILVCVEITRLVHCLQHLAAQEDHVRRQPAARSDPASHRHRIHRIKHHGCFAIRDSAAVGTEIPSGVEAKRRARGHADFVVRDRTEDDGARRGTETVNDHGVAG
jgi:hypothetical protein